MAAIRTGALIGITSGTLIKLFLTTFTLTPIDGMEALFITDHILDPV